MSTEAVLLSLRLRRGAEVDDLRVAVEQFERVYANPIAKQRDAELEAALLAVQGAAGQARATHLEAEKLAAHLALTDTQREG